MIRNIVLVIILFSSFALSTQIYAENIITLELANQKVNLIPIMHKRVHFENRPSFFFMSILSSIPQAPGRPYSNISHEMAIKLWPLKGITIKQFVTEQDKFLKAGSSYRKLESFISNENEAMTYIEDYTVVKYKEKPKLFSKRCIYYQRISDVVLVVDVTFNDILIKLPHQNRKEAISLIRKVLESLKINEQDFLRGKTILKKVGAFQ